MKSPKKKQSATLTYDPLSVKYLQANVSFDMPTIKALKDFYLKERTLKIVKIAGHYQNEWTYNVLTPKNDLVARFERNYSVAKRPDLWDVVLFRELGGEFYETFRSMAACKSFIRDAALAKNWILK